MGLLDKIKGKKGDKGSKGPKERNVLDMVQEPVVAKADRAQTEQKIKDDTGSAYRILMSAHLSEKTNMLSGLNRYVFKVSPNANKIEIGKAVEKAYDVHVTAVNIINTKGKRRRMGRKQGQTSDWKKAIVTVKVGEKISGLTEGV